ncbi:FAD-dependent oxidoreductase [Geobacter sp. FeAm09]|nr:FAD-dependent oxidoreductase [Geobacter sp. FeAm09]
MQVHPGGVRQQGDLHHDEPGLRHDPDAPQEYPQEARAGGVRRHQPVRLPDEPETGVGGNTGYRPSSNDDAPEEGTVVVDKVYDVVVVGSGFAGLAAAIEARNAGCSVLIIEKMRVPGGNSALSGGLFAVADSPLQAAAGIVDSPARLVSDMLRAGKGLNHPDLVRTVAGHSLEAYFWARDYLGVTFDDALIHGGGHSVPRIYNTPACSGAAIVQALLVKCRELGLTIRMQCALKDLIQDESGRVTGVAVADGHIFPRRDSGTTRRITARRGVVLASGGFCQDVAFRMVQNPRLDGSLETTNHPGATAEGLVSALKVGATPVHLSWIQLGPWTSRDEKGWGWGPCSRCWWASPTGS